MPWLPPFGGLSGQGVAPGQACCVSFQVTALSLYGGMTLPLAMGAVVVGVPTTFQTPLSGHFGPVRAVVPMGLRVMLILNLLSERSSTLGR